MRLHYLAFLLTVFVASKGIASPKKKPIIVENKFVKDLDEIYIKQHSSATDVTNNSKYTKSYIEAIISENVNPLCEPKHNLNPLKNSTDTLFNVRWWNPTEAEKLYLQPSKSVIKDQMKLEKLDRHNSFEKAFNKTNHKKLININ